MSCAKRRRARNPSVDSGWNIFVEETRQELMSHNSDLSKREIYSIASKLWKEESCDRKAQYARMERRHKRRRKESEERDSDSVYDNEKIKQHISAYSVFVNEKQQELKELYPILTLMERSKLIANMWQELGYKEKLIFENKAKCVNRKIDKDSTDEDEKLVIIKGKNAECHDECTDSTEPCDLH